MYRAIFFFFILGRDKRGRGKLRPAYSHFTTATARRTIVRVVQNLSKPSEFLLIHLNIFSVGLLFVAEVLLESTIVVLKPAELELVPGPHGRSKRRQGEGVRGGSGRARRARLTTSGRDLNSDGQARGR